MSNYYYNHIYNLKTKMYREPHNLRSMQSIEKKNIKNKIIKRTLRWYIFLLLIFIFLLIGWKTRGVSNAMNPINEIRSGWRGLCMDDYHDQINPGAKLDVWTCNKTNAQNFQISYMQIEHDGLCVGIGSNNQVDLENCQKNDPNQIWFRDQNGYYNPNLVLCLQAVSPVSGTDLTVGKCNNLTKASQEWLDNFDYANYPCTGTQGQVVACNALKQWMIWNNEPYNHENLLNTYTGGAPYEEWCADFVSYIYKISGYPFSNGNYNNWDENNANLIYTQGFNVHSANGSYIPQPGDVGHFTYYGGHVEIVVVGGKNPVFIYGDSATIDPTTGNGQMEANTILSVKNEGQINYYYSPTANT